MLFLAFGCVPTAPPATEESSQSSTESCQFSQVTFAAFLRTSAALLMTLCLCCLKFPGSLISATFSFYRNISILSLIPRTHSSLTFFFFPSGLETLCPSLISLRNYFSLSLALVYPSLPWLGNSCLCVFSPLPSYLSSLLTQGIRESVVK